MILKRKRPTTILLGSNDAAVIFRASGGFELLMPDKAKGVLPDHIMDAARAALLIQCPEAVKIMNEFMEKIRADDGGKVNVN